MLPDINMFKVLSFAGKGGQQRSRQVNSLYNYFLSMTHFAKTIFLCSEYDLRIQVHPVCLNLLGTGKTH